MPTILELFKGSPQDLAVSATGDSSKSNFVKSVKNFVDQETTGIRIKSLVEINNPLIYGTGTIRITNRSIQTTEIQKGATGGDDATGGLVGKGLSKITGGKVNSLSEARDAVTSKLGLPQNLIPSKIISDNPKVFGQKGGEQDTMINLAQIRQDGAGTGLGQFLKSTGGGNPQTVGKQAVGKGIGLVKDELRKQAFGSPQTIGQVSGKGLEDTYSSTQPYTTVLTSEGRNYLNEGGPNSVSPTDTEATVKFANQSIDKVDLKLVSPVYGIERTDGKFGKSEYAYKTKTGKKNAPVVYDPTQRYTDVLKSYNGDEEPLRNVRGFSGKGDTINNYAPSDEYTREEAEGIGLIPFWVSGLDSSKPVFFRAILSAVSETVTPTWSEFQFVGNPYKFHTYSSVDRELSFTLKIYCMNETELIKNWEKIEYLTSKTYPLIDKELSIANAPFIKFRLGNMYVDKVAFINSLTYTVDDNSTWETDIDGMLLPKFIDVTATFKFVEWEGIEKTLYNFRRNPEAIKQLREERTKFIERREGLGTITTKENVPAYNSLGVQEVEPKAPQKVSVSGKGGTSSNPTNINTGKEETTPKQQGQENKKLAASSASSDEKSQWKNKLESKYGKEIANIISNSGDVNSDFELPKNYVGWVRDAGMGSKQVLAINLGANNNIIKSITLGSSPFDIRYMKIQVEKKIEFYEEMRPSL